MIPDEIGDEPESEIDAQADAAPIVPELAYQPRRKWRPGNCAGFIINTINPVARLTWPKKREGKEFLDRISDAPGKMPPEIPANPLERPAKRATR